ncbi:MAG: NUDIX domain-containing protein [Thiohalocapsa sp.]
MMAAGGGGLRRARRGAGALLVTEDGHYLMQHRDHAAGNRFPGWWCCFGGGIEPGERPMAALRRELREEIGLEARSQQRFTELSVLLPFAAPCRERILYFAVPLSAAEIAGLRLGEGAAMALWRPEELAREERVVPWDLAAVLMHARRADLFSGAAAPRSD